MPKVEINVSTYIKYGDYNKTMFPTKFKFYNYLGHMFLLNDSGSLILISSILITILSHLKNITILMFNFLGWFGMRKDFCSFVLGACPLLQEYANIAYHSERRTNGVELQPQVEHKEKTVKRADLLKPVVPIISIEIPD